MWIVGPIAVGLIYALTTTHDKRRAAEADRFRKEAHLKLVKNPPSDLAEVFTEAGGGSPIGLYEVLPKVAYAGVFEADVGAGSDHQTVVMRLEKAAPTFVARPLPVVDGQRAPYTGVPFPKDPELMEHCLVEGAEEKGIRNFLKRPLRDALLQHEGLWLRVSGKTMAVTTYANVGVAGLHELLEAADIFFAEHGPEGEPSLLFDPEDADEPEAPEVEAPKQAAQPAKGAAKGSTPKSKKS